MPYYLLSLQQMGEKKKHREKDKKKDKRRDKDEKKKKKDKYSSESDESDSDESESESSRSNSKMKRDKKQKKIKKDKRGKKESPPQKEAAPSSNLPYDFSSVVPTSYPATIPGIKGLSIPVIPPPMPSVPSTASVPKPKSKEPNIFKLLPKLHYGAVLFAKTIYSGEYLGESSLDKLIIEMAKNIEQTTKDEQHKKGMANISKCITELQKILNQQKQQKVKEEMTEVPREKNNRYEILQKVHRQSLKNA